MKTSELIKALKAGGCYFVRHGGNHDLWYSPLNARLFSVPRHSAEMKTGTANKILREAGLK